MRQTKLSALRGPQQKRDKLFPMARKKISKAVEKEVLTKSLRRCCVCVAVDGDLRPKKGQIAHLDQDPSNNDLDNLAFLCFDHHDQYDSRTRQSKNLALAEVKAYRAALHAKVADGSLLEADEASDDKPSEEGWSPMTKWVMGIMSSLIVAGILALIPTLFDGGSEFPADRALTREIEAIQTFRPGRGTISASSMSRDFFVGSTVLVRKEPLPLINVVLVNRTGQDQVVVGLILWVREYSPYAAIPESRFLKPLSVINVTLPFAEGTFEHSLSDALLVADGEIVAVQIRTSVSGPDGSITSPLEAGRYRLAFGFKTVDGIVAATGEVSF